jgi:hypothetical protein
LSTALTATTITEEFIDPSLVRPVRCLEDILIILTGFGVEAVSSVR